MPEAVVYQCPNCNGRLVFDGALDKLVCEFCESEFEPIQIEQLYAEKQAAADAKASGLVEDETKGVHSDLANQIAEVDRSEQPSQFDRSSQTDDPIQTYLHHANWENLDQSEVVALNCSSCGAQLMATSVTAATNCPYCGNATIVPGQLADTLKPHYVIPFRYNREAAVAALKNYYKGKKLLPDSFKDENHLEEIQGIYVPFWLYSGTAHASLTTEARNIRTWVDSTHSYVATDHFQVHREGDMKFYRVPVDGSTKMPDAHMDSIEPFDYSELVPFSLGYLPGYLADRYDLDGDDCCGRMRHRIETTCSQTLKDSVVGYAEVDATPASSQLYLAEVGYALLPVWMLHTRWKSKDYLFAMNGQTGKFVGDLPIDMVKTIKTFFTWFVPSAAIVALIVNFTLGFGF